MSNHNQYNNNAAGRAKFVTFIEHFTRPKQADRYVLECITEMLDDFEPHHINEHAWAHPNNGFVAKYYLYFYTNMAEVPKQAVKIVTYFGGLVAMNALGDSIMKDRILDEHNLDIEQLPTVPFIAFTPLAWMQSKGNWEPPHGLWENEPAIGSVPHDQIVEALGPETPSVFYDNRMWFRFKRIIDRMEAAGFWDHVDYLDNMLFLGTRSNGLAGRMLWYLAVHIFDLQGGDDNFGEDMIMDMAEEVGSAGMQYAFGHAVDDTRGAVFRVPADPALLQEHVNKVRIAIAGHMHKGRWRRAGQSELAKKFVERLREARPEFPIQDLGLVDAE